MNYDLWKSDVGDWPSVGADRPTAPPQERELCATAVLDPSSVAHASPELDLTGDDPNGEHQDDDVLDLSDEHLDGLHQDQAELDLTHDGLDAVSPGDALMDADRAALRGHLAELKELLEAEDQLAVRAAARETVMAWREAAMRAQLEQVRSGERIPLLKARPEFHVSVPNSECGDRSDGPLDPEGGRACPSCGEPSRFPGGRCDPCFAAALRVVPTDVLVGRKGR
jgi:hypothetical protein